VYILSLHEQDYKENKHCETQHNLLDLFQFFIALGRSTVAFTRDALLLLLLFLDVAFVISIFLHDRIVGLCTPKHTTAVAASPTPILAIEKQGITASDTTLALLHFAR
jgi:hypothetical protein